MHLLDLPPEILNTITDLLAFPDSNHLRATCRTFAGMIPPSPLPDWKALIEAEDCAWARARNRLTCVYCARLLPAARFTDKEKAGSPRWRCCADCLREVLIERDGLIPRCVRWPHWHRTALSDARTVRVDRRTGVCKTCFNAFERWGARDATREACRECEAETWERQGRDWGEAARLWRDLWRVGGEGLGEFWAHEFDWYDLDEVRLEFGALSWGWGFGYCDCCLPQQPFRGWREGWRGVNVMRLEEV